MTVKEGQKVFVKAIGNAGRRYKEIHITEEIVESVGIKYFTLVGWPRERFFIDTWTHDGRGYASNYQAYESMIEIQNEIEMREKMAAIGKWAEYGCNRASLTIDEVRAVYDIMNAAEKRYKGV